MLVLLLFLTMQFVHIDTPPEWVDRPKCETGEKIHSRRMIPNFRTKVTSCTSQSGIWVETRVKGKLVRMVFRDPWDYNSFMEQWGLRK